METLAALGNTMSAQHRPVTDVDVMYLLLKIRRRLFLKRRAQEPQTAVVGPKALQSIGWATLTSNADALRVAAEAEDSFPVNFECAAVQLVVNQATQFSR